VSRAFGFTLLPETLERVKLRIADGYHLEKSHSVKSFFKGGKDFPKELRACAVSVIPRGFILLVLMVASGALNLLEVLNSS